jgi:DNA invertase Pin-like site-specific DNA recombinase
MIRTEAITVSGPRYNRKTYVLRTPYRSGLTPVFRPFATQTPIRGRKPIAPERRQEVLRLAAQGTPKASIARQLGMGEATVYRILAVTKQNEVGQRLAGKWATSHPA